MSAFRVGQRVRLVRPVSPENANIEGVIREFSFIPKGAPDCDGGVFPYDCNVIVHWPTLGGDHPQHTSNLEPILPEGAAPSTWAECAWQPEHMRATA